MATEPERPEEAPGVKGRSDEQAAQSLYQILGAPLHALIEAESAAANATAAFIEQVGFAEDDEPPNIPEEEKKSRRHVGKLRTLSFHQERLAGDGSMTKYKVEVPLLSIVPIPALQIKEADLEFYAKIVAIGPRTPLRATAAGESGKGTSADQDKDIELVSPNVLEMKHLEMKALLGRGQPGAPTVPQSAFDMQVHIKIKVVQADPPAGLSRLFNLMEQSISSTPVPKPRNEAEAGP